MNSLALAILIVKTCFDIGKNKKDGTRASRFVIGHHIVETDPGQKQELLMDCELSMNSELAMNCELLMNW